MRSWKSWNKWTWQEGTRCQAMLRHLVKANANTLYGPAILLPGVHSVKAPARVWSQDMPKNAADQSSWRDNECPLTAGWANRLSLWVLTQLYTKWIDLRKAVWTETVTCRTRVELHLWSSVCMRPSDTLFRDTNICGDAIAKSKVVTDTKGIPPRGIKRTLRRAPRSRWCQ